MKYLLIFLILTIPSTCLAQHFSGEITYKISIVPKTNELNVDSLKSISQGEITTYKITSNYYKSTYFKNNKETYSYTYDNISKRMYDTYVDRPYITFRDSRKANFDYKPGKIYRDSIVKILGKDCFMVKYESSYGNSTTYYSDNIKVDYETFKGHQVGNWYNKLSEVDGCITMKTITELDTHYEIMEAVKITPMKLSQKDFEIQPDKLIVADFTALDKMVELSPPSEETIKCYQEKTTQGQSKRIDKTEPEACYVSFVITTKGELLFPETYDNPNQKLDIIAMDIIKNCGLSFVPGEIQGRKVSSMVYFPIQF
ncbi:MAG: hypothetical protein AAF611_09940 [Bacteroidota bacterium]